MNKDKLIPELRFPEFKNEGEWDYNIVDNLVLTVTPPKKLTSSNYQANGKFPIIDQSKNFYCGWTNDNDAIISNDLPLVIFGDHTCIIKLARKPFAQGADGIKILKVKSKILSEYLFHYLQHNEIKMEDYKRHFSILKDKVVVFPKIEKGEQQKIASCLSSLDEVIAAHSQKLALLKDHKKGLMQNLFPNSITNYESSITSTDDQFVIRNSQSRNLPKYRFKEFEKDGEWVEKKLGDIAENLDSKRIPITSNQRKKGNIPYYGASGIIDFVKDYIYNDDLLCISEDGANLVDRNYPIAFTIRGKTWVNNHAHVLKFENASIHILVEKYMNSLNVEPFLTGAAQPKLNRGKLDVIPVPLPKNPKEQQKIASCLSSLDALITAQAEKIEQLKLHKKGLMQGLFPKIES